MTGKIIRAVFLIFVVTILSACAHNAIAPIRQITSAPIKQEASTLGIPVDISNARIQELAKKDAPVPLKEDHFNAAKLSVLSPVTFPVFVAINETIKGPCDFVQKHRITL